MIRPVATLLAVVALAGCGGDDGADEAEAIDAAVSRLSTETDGAKLCGEVFTAGLVERVYGGAAACLRSSSDLGAGGTPIKGTDHEVDGDDANVKVSLSFPVGVGKVQVGGTIELERTGDDWRVSDFGSDFLRELVVKASVAGLAEGVTEEQFADPEQVASEVTGCAQRRLAEVDDTTMRTYGYAALSQREDRIEGLKQEFYSCLESGPASRAALRQKFEEGIREGAQERSIPASIATCVVARLKRTASDEIIAKDSVASIRQGKPGLSARLQSLFDAALRQCQ